VGARAGLTYLQGFTVVPVSLGHHAPLVGAAALAGWAPARLATTAPTLGPTAGGHAAIQPATAQ
jgi:hypothetical protein